MLELKRKKDQSIDIGENIKVFIRKTRPGSVDIGIEAPRHIQVWRTEIKARINYNDNKEKNQAKESTL
jgi:carbon storage regulator